MPETWVRLACCSMPNLDIFFCSLVFIQCLFANVGGLELAASSNLLILPVPKTGSGPWVLALPSMPFSPLLKHGSTCTRRTSVVESSEVLGGYISWYLIAEENPLNARNQGLSSGKCYSLDSDRCFLGMTEALKSALWAIWATEDGLVLFWDLNK